MEKHVGALWDRMIAKSASRRHPAARVALEDVRIPVGVLFRALGGDGRLGIEAVTDSRHQARRGWLDRLAGNDAKTPWFWRDGRALRLPATLDLFPEPGLNRELYLWMAALAALAEKNESEDWFASNQDHTHRLLHQFPGMQSRYERLVTAHLAQRPDPAKLPPDQATRERAVCAALKKPGSVPLLPTAAGTPWPVPLWSHPTPPVMANAGARPDDDTRKNGSGESRSAAQKKRRQGRYMAPPKKEGGLLLHRFESIFSWADFINVDRATDEEEDLETAEKTADDLEFLGLTRDRQSSARRLRFDLDLPPESRDDISLGAGILLPEWDWRQQRLLPNHCRIQPMVARNAQPMALPQHLAGTARRLRAQFASVRLGRSWIKRQRDGMELDLEAYIRYQGARLAGTDSVAEDHLYRDLRRQDRNLATLLLADLSLSTDTWINDETRIIDLIRDALFLFAEALSASRDRFALYGFSSRRHTHVRFHEIKSFDTPCDDRILGRIQAVKPGFYTRMGAAIRHGTTLLARQPAARRLLLLLTDGKPNDIDHYEGRYGIEDTRMAVLEAQKAGVQPFCVTMDREATNYSTHLFGPGGFAQIRQASELPRKLPLLYHRLTG
ncbi:MAG: VWA domain-containing protein [Magnetococcales bacterium]|nr:VWA domain-containing protein [Magnetococcales bacterium]